MNKLILILTTLLLFGCGQKKSLTKLISPAGNYELINNVSEFVIDRTNTPDSINEINSFVSVNNLIVFASDSGIYFLDKDRNELKRYFKLNIEDLLWIELTPNFNNSKLLVKTSTGQTSTALIFQIDLNTFEIQWFAKHSGQIVTSSYSNNGNLIALGTGYRKKDNQKDTAEYYSSLFLINAITGNFLDYFQQGESMSQIEFSKNDNLIYSVLGWPHVDTYVWKVSDKNEKTGVFGKDQTRFYDAFSIDKENFITTGADGIYKWNITNPNNPEIVYRNYINDNDRIFRVNQAYILVNYQNGLINPPTIKYFDQNFSIIDSVNLNTSFNEVELSKTYLTGIDKGNNTVSFYNLDNKSIDKIITTDSLQYKILIN